MANSFDDVLVALEGLADISEKTPRKLSIFIQILFDCTKQTFVELFNKGETYDTDEMVACLTHLVNQNSEKIKLIHIIVLQALDFLLCLSSDDRYAKAHGHILHLKPLAACAMIKFLHRTLINEGAIRSDLFIGIRKALHPTLHYLLDIELGNLLTLKDFQDKTIAQQDAVAHELKAFESGEPELSLEATRTILRTYMLQEKHQALLRMKIIEAHGQVKLAEANALSNILKQIPGIPAKLLADVPLGTLLLLPVKQLKSASTDTVNLLAQIPLAQIALVPVDALKFVLTGSTQILTFSADALLQLLKLPVAPLLPANGGAASSQAVAGRNEGAWYSTIGGSVMSLFGSSKPTADDADGKAARRKKDTNNKSDGPA